MAKSSRTRLHIDPEQILYAVTKADLEALARGNVSLWMGVCLATLPLALSLLPNAVNSYYEAKQKELTLPAILPFLLNLIIGVISLLLSAIFGFVWYKSSQSNKSLVDQINGQDALLHKHER